MKILFSLIIIAMILFFADVIFTETEYYTTGKVTLKHYSPSETHTGVGYGTSPNGNNGIIITG